MVRFYELWSEVWLCWLDSENSLVAGQTPSNSITTHCLTTAPAPVLLTTPIKSIWQTCGLSEIFSYNESSEGLERDHCLSEDRLQMTKFGWTTLESDNKFGVLSWHIVTHRYNSNSIPPHIPAVHYQLMEIINCTNLIVNFIGIFHNINNLDLNTIQCSPLQSLELACSQLFM